MFKNVRVTVARTVLKLMCYVAVVNLPFNGRRFGLTLLTLLPFNGRVE